jgi:SpoVK/Ycf46/Vps4 family AAA+-type ATPase
MACSIACYSAAVDTHAVAGMAVQWLDPLSKSSISRPTGGVAAQLLHGCRFTGADIQALCREAAVAALEETLLAETVAARHFDAALQRVKPSNSSSSSTSSSPPGSGDKDGMMTMYWQFQRHSGLQAP